MPGLRSAIRHLAGIGYAEKQVRERLGLADLTDLRWRAIPIYRAEQLATRDPLAAAIDLFLLQGAIPQAELDGLFSQTDQESLLRTGLLLIDENGVAHARASLYPVGDSLIFSDHAWPTLPHPGIAEVSPNHLMYIGTDSRWLARATVRRPTGTSLDLCTGSGIHAVLSAAHSRQAFAVDINPRAAQCTRFNALACGAANIEVRVGDLYEPLDGQTFDLITANPPFVPSPRDSLQYRDGGRSGEDVQRRIIAGLPRHLAPGGIAQIVTEFGERGDEPLADRLRLWLGGAPMDIHILRLKENSAANYAIGHADGTESYGAFLDSVHDWAANLKTQGYHRIVSVLLAFQWSDSSLGPPWTRTEVPQSLHVTAGNEIAKAFATERTWLKLNRDGLPTHSVVGRAGPVALLEAHVLGHQVPTKYQAELLGKALPILQTLDAMERNVLVLTEKPMVVSELIERAQKVNLKKEAVMAATATLIRHGLLVIDSDRPT